MLLTLKKSTAMPEVRSSGICLERRIIRARDVRCETDSQGAQFVTGYAARFNSLSEDLGGWKERIKPGAFARALREQQDVRHLINHDASMILGRTKAGTTTLTEDAQGLAFRTRLGTRSYEKDLGESLGRGDIDGSSFGFCARKDHWTHEDGWDVRELHDVDMVDISTVTYPAYQAAQSTLDARTMFPDGVPAELRERLKRFRAGGRAGGARGAVEPWRVHIAHQEAAEARMGAIRAGTLRPAYPEGNKMFIEHLDELDQFGTDPTPQTLTATERRERDELRHWAEGQIAASGRPLGL